MFVNLHNHSNYSFLDGLSTVEGLTKRAVELGQPAIALTEHGNMCSFPDLEKFCIEQKIKPIFGVELYVTHDASIKDRKTLDKLAAEDERWQAYSTVRKRGKKKQEQTVWAGGNHLVVLAKNNQGLKNLFRLASEAGTTGYYYKPLADFDMIAKYGEGLIGASACIAGTIPQLILKGNTDAAIQQALRYAEVFDDFYLELQPSQMEEQLQVNRALIKISRQTGIPLICTSDSHYINQQDWETHDVLLAMQMKQKLSDPTRMRFADQCYFIHSEDDMVMANMPAEAIQNTIKIAEMCDVVIDRSLKPPIYPGIDNADEELARLTKTELEERSYFEDINVDEYQKQLEYELEVIQQKQLSNYFLIVKDYIAAAKKIGVAVGPGRGSSAGSIVANLADITLPDPIKNGLYFSRFLNPERNSYPDIDTDFSQKGRHQVIKYIAEKYGYDHVCGVSTYSTLKPKLVIRDVARTLEMPIDKVDAITRLLPSVTDKTLRKLVEDPEGDEALKKAYEENKRLFDLAYVFEGAPRQAGVAASAIIISPIPLTDAIPLIRAPRESEAGVYMSQVDSHQLEDLGFIKFDFLGLRTLDVIEDTLADIEKRHHKKINIWQQMLIDNFSDEKVYQALVANDTDGIFQLESSGMQQVIKDLRPKDFDAIVATIALYRPGPMALIPEYIARYRGNKSPEYVSPEVEPLLRRTYGIIVYQEQIIGIAIQLAGYTPGQADSLRRAVGKKKKDLLAYELHCLVHGDPERNIPGLIKNGMEEATAKELADIISASGDYNFNLSHAVSYAMITYATAWLKAYYPKEFTAAQLTSIVLSGGNKKDNLEEYLDNFKARGYEVKGPDINESELDFTVSGNNLRFGLSIIKDFGEQNLQLITDNVPFEDLHNFAELCCKQETKFNKRQINALVFSGALDSLEPTLNRAEIYTKLYQLITDNEDIGPVELSINRKKYKLTEDVLPELEEYYLGLPVKLDVLKQFQDDPYLPHVPYRREAEVHGLLLDKRKVVTKSGQDMAFLTVRFLSGKTTVTMFGEEVAKVDRLNINTIYRFSLYKSMYNSKDSYRANKIVYGRECRMKSTEKDA